MLGACLVYIIGFYFLLGGCQISYSQYLKRVTKKIATTTSGGFRSSPWKLSTISPPRRGRHLVFEGVVTPNNSPKTERLNEGIHLIAWFREKISSCSSLMYC